MRKKIIGLVILICLIATSSFAAQDIVFEARVDKNIVTIGEKIQLLLIFQGTSDVPAPQITEPEGFSASYLGPSTLMSIVNGKMSSSISHIYVLIPLKMGKFTLGPFSAQYNGQTYQSHPISVEVIGKSQQAPAKAAGKSASGPAEEQLKDRIFVQLAVGKRDIYLNETVPLTVRLYVSNLAIKDIEYPSLTLEGFSKDKFEKPVQYQKELAGLVYDVIEFKTNIYPFKTGTLNLGPAQIKCNLVVRKSAQRSRSGSPFDDFFDNDDFFNDFFSRFESYPLELKSSELTINVKPFPSENKPPDFDGAVGQFDMEIEADPLNVNAGDPITLKAKITGVGNFASVNPPVLENTKDLKVYQPAAKTQDGQKVFEQVVMPLNENVTRIPVVSFSFFDPSQGAYQTIKRGPIAIVVSKADQYAKPKLVEAQPTTAGGKGVVIPQTQEDLGRDIIYIKDSPGDIRQKGRFLYRNKFFIWLFVVWPLVFFILLFIEKKNQRLRTDIRYARMRKAYKNARRGLAAAAAFSNADRQEEFYAKIFKTLQGYLGDRLHVSSGGITIETAVEYLRSKGAPGEIITGLNQVFEVCDAARFAPLESARADMPQLLRLATQIVEDLEKVKL
jgi:hypothetical protein